MKKHFLQNLSKLSKSLNSSTQKLFNPKSSNSKPFKNNTNHKSTNSKPFKNNTSPKFNPSPNNSPKKTKLSTTSHNSSHKPDSTYKPFNQVPKPMTIATLKLFNTWQFNFKMPTLKSTLSNSPSWKSPPSKWMTPSLMTHYLINPTKHLPKHLN